MYKLNPFSASEDTTVLEGLRALSRLEKQMQYFIACKVPTCWVLFIPGGTKRLVARNKYVRVLPKIYPGEGEQVLFLRRHKWSGPSGHLPGPLGVCNPNEKQKPPPLPVTVWIHASLPWAHPYTTRQIFSSVLLSLALGITTVTNFCGLLLCP